MEIYGEELQQMDKFRAIQLSTLEKTPPIQDSKLVSIFFLASFLRTVP